MLRRREWLLGVTGVGMTGWVNAEAMPSVAYGTLQRWERFASRHVDARHVDIWLPPDYAEKAAQGQRYPVVYMHDGQMLFDARTTWNGKAWNMDRAAQQSHAAGARDCIIVGVWNGGPLRHSEYYPGKFLPYLSDESRERFVREGLAGRSRSDAYLRFLVEELKPSIDARFATLTGREDCCLMGSSMGGLISAYALCEYPSVFGRAVCFSTHWIGTHERNTEFPAAACAYLAHALPDPASVRFWTDRGTTELDALYGKAHEDVVAVLKRRGYGAPNCVMRVVEGTGHNEAAWAERAPDALRFLLGVS